MRAKLYLIMFSGELQGIWFHFREKRAAPVPNGFPGLLAVFLASSSK